MTDYNTLYFCAFRYAIGRKTYIVSDVANLLIEAVEKQIIDVHTIDQIYRETVLAINSGFAGMRMDVIEWQKLLTKMGEHNATP